MIDRDNQIKFQMHFQKKEGNRRNSMGGFPWVSGTGKDHADGLAASVAFL